MSSNDDDRILSELLDGCGLDVRLTEASDLSVEAISTLVEKGKERIWELKVKQRELAAAKKDTVLALPMTVDRTEQALQRFQQRLQVIRDELSRTALVPKRSGPEDDGRFSSVSTARGLTEHVRELRANVEAQRAAVANLQRLAQCQMWVRDLTDHVGRQAVPEAVEVLRDLQCWLGQARRDDLPGLRFAEAAISDTEVALVDMLVHVSQGEALFEELDGIQALQLRSPEASGIHATLDGLEPQFCTATAAPVLDWARTLLLAPKWHADCRCDEPPFPACTVSKAAKALADRSVALLEKAATAQRPVTRQSLLQTAVWLPQLYRILLPTAHSSALQVAALSLQFQNDLLYMAFRLSRWRVAHTPTEDDAVAASLLEAEQQLSGEAGVALAECLQREQETLEDVVCAAGGFADVRDAPRYRRVHDAISQVASQLQALRRTWQAILPAPLLPHALGHILNAVMGAIVDGMLHIPAIAADEVPLLLAILEPLLVCEQWFVDQRALQGLARQGKGGFERQATASTKRHALAFLKFKSLLDLLPATLSNVMAQWEGGQLLQFAAPELRALIAALFPDSPQRKASLSMLSTA